MRALFRFPEVEGMGFGTMDDGGVGDFLMVFLFQSWLDIAVVIGF